MQSARLPRSVCDELDRKIRRFLWGGTAMQRKVHLIAWDVVTKDKSQGGLGLRGMRPLNSAYLMKLGWRLQAEPSSLWARILRQKYCKGSDLNRMAARHSACSNVWKGIMETRDLVEQGMGKTVSDGKQTKF